MDGRPTDAALAMLPYRLPATADDGAHGQVASNHACEATLSSAALEHNPDPGTQCAHTNDLNAGQQAKSRDMLEEYYAMEMAESQAAAAESAISPGYGNTPHQSAHLHSENNDPQDAIRSMQAQPRQPGPLSASTTTTSTYPARFVADEARDDARGRRIPQPAISSLHVGRGRTGPARRAMLMHPSRKDLRSPGGRAYAAVIGSPFRLAPPPTPTLPTATDLPYKSLPTHTQLAPTVPIGKYAHFGPSIFERCKLRDQLVVRWRTDRPRPWVLTSQDLARRARPFFRLHLPRAYEAYVLFMAKNRHRGPTSTLESFTPFWMNYWDRRVKDAYNTCVEAAKLEKQQLTDDSSDKRRVGEHFLNHLNYSFDKWRSWFEDATTEELFKYLLENEHCDIADSWSKGWRNYFFDGQTMRKRKHE